jgi:hypothetical protein
LQDTQRANLSEAEQLEQGKRDTEAKALMAEFLQVIY